MGISLIALSLAFGILVLYSYQRLLFVEHRCMPDFGSYRAVNFERRVSFELLTPEIMFGASRVPRWVVEYHELPPYHKNAEDPAIAVDLFGHISGAWTRDVIATVNDYQRQHP